MGFLLVWTSMYSPYLPQMLDPSVKRSSVLLCVQNNFSLFFLEREIHLIIKRTKEVFINTDLEDPSNSLLILKFLSSFQKVMQSEYDHGNN